jgi:hypothetical protein
VIQSNPLHASSIARSIAMPLTPKQLGWMLQLPVLTVVVAFVIFHYALWGMGSYADSFRYPLAGIGLLVAYPIGIVFHEVLHAVGFAGFGGAHWGSIRFGVYRMVAYCQCDTPVSAPGFRSAVAFPGVALGLFPAAVGLSTGLAWLTVFGALLTSAALGDLLTLWVLRTVPPTAKIVYRPHIARYEVLS